MEPKKFRGWALMVLGAILCLTALWLLVKGLNAIAYLMGAGEQVTVTVTDSSVDTGSRSMRESGRGYYERDGEHIEVFSAHMTEGDEIVTRLPLIPLDAGAGTSINANDEAAYDDLKSFFGVALLGGGGLVILGRGRFTATGRATMRLKRNRGRADESH